MPLVKTYMEFTGSTCLKIFLPNNQFTIIIITISDTLNIGFSFGIFKVFFSKDTNSITPLSTKSPTRFPFFQDPSKKKFLLTMGNNVIIILVNAKLSHMCF